MLFSMVLLLIWWRYDCRKRKNQPRAFVGWLPGKYRMQLCRTQKKSISLYRFNWLNTV